VGDVEVLVPLEGVIDLGSERARLGKVIEKLGKDAEMFERKLANASFVERAPPEVVEETRGKAAELRARESRVRANLQRLG
jgi:valyl-tRNA synthetase